MNDYEGSSVWAKKKTPPVKAAAPCSGVGARSGLPFEELRRRAKSKRMEHSIHSGDPFYYHSHDCQGCDGECYGLLGWHIAQDAADIQDVSQNTDSTNQK